MTYQLIYSSEATTPMGPEDLEELLLQARSNNGTRGVTGALIYAERMFLQILEGDRPKVQGLMERIRRDLRHENVTVLQEREISSAFFGHWKMAYVSATREQIARWAGVGKSVEFDRPLQDDGQELQRTSQFAHEILSLLVPDEGAHPN